MKLRKPKQKTKREYRRSRKRLIFISLLLIVIFTVFTWVMNHERFKISKITISGNKTILDIDIHDIIDNNLDRKILWLLPRDNVLLTNTKKIENSIKNNFPKIYEAKVIIKEGSELVISIEEREPHSLWCKNENYILAFDEECFFADQKGYIYGRAPYFSGGIFEKIYTTTDMLTIGEQVLNKDDFIDFFEFTSLLLEKYGINVYRVFVNDNNETQIYIGSLLKNNFSIKPYIIYDNDDSYEIVIRNIGLMIQHELFKKEWKKIPERLEFVDLRINDQIRYKFTTEEDILKRKKKELKENENSTEKTE